MKTPLFMDEGENMPFVSIKTTYFMDRESKGPGDNLYICRIINTLMENGKINVYESPVIKVIDICLEGVLCRSNEHVDENYGEW